MTMFPMVPDVPGVPQVARDAANSIISGTLSVVGVIGSLSGQFDQLSEDGPDISSVTSPAQWGIFDDSGAHVAKREDEFLRHRPQERDLLLDVVLRCVYRRRRHWRNSRLIFLFCDIRC